MSTRPNLLFVFSDQHRACSLGCYGNRDVKTPRLDGFAAEGALFERCVSNIPVCVPMRGSLLTGLFPWGHGALTNDLPIKAETPSVAQALNAAGYHTGYIGKWHLGGVPRDRSIPESERLGFKEWKVANCTHDYEHSYYDDEAGRRTSFAVHESIGQTDLALDFLERAAQAGKADHAAIAAGVGKAAAASAAASSIAPASSSAAASPAADPWALYLSWGPPHDPYRAVPQKYLDLYPPESIQLRENVQFPVRVREGVELDEAQLRRALQGYYALTSLLDEQFGRLLDALKRLGLADNTLVVYTSDHGDMLGSQGLKDKQLPFDESIMVPLLARMPGVVPPGARQGLISLIDLPASLFSLLGVRLPGPVHSRDFSALFRDPAAPGAEDCLIMDLVPCHQAWWRGQKRAWIGLRSSDGVYARWEDGSPYLVHDLRADPWEKENLAGRGTAIERDLSARLDADLAALKYTFRPWQTMIREDGYKDLWNKSQAYFKMEPLS